MPQIFSKIGQTVKSNPLGVAGLGIGTLSNFLANRKKQQYLDFLQNQMKQRSDIINNPEKWAAFMSTFRRPMQQGLISGVTNAVQGSLAERGLSASPTIFQSTLSQALAPYLQNNEDMATRAALSALPGGNAPSPSEFGGNTNLTGLMQTLLRGKSGGSSASAGYPASPDQDPNFTPWPENGDGESASPDSGGGFSSLNLNDLLQNLQYGFAGG